MEKNPKFLNQPTKIMGLTLVEIVSSLVGFFVSSKLLGLNPLFSLAFALLILFTLLGSRALPSAHYIHFFMKDDLIKREDLSGK